LRLPLSGAAADQPLARHGSVPRSIMGEITPRRRSRIVRPAS
jgi:hypothetical protein